MKWFKHDSDASIDSKLQSLLLDYGASGYGLYWYCIELIAQNVNENNITFELDHDARIISRNLNLTYQETKDMMKYMIDLGLFSLNNEKLVCYSLAKRLDQSMTSSPKMRNIISSIKENHDSVMIKSCKNRIDKKRKEENKEDKNIDKKEIEFTFTLKNLTQFENLSDEYKTKLEDEIIKLNKNLSYEDFTMALMAKGYKYKNFLLAYKTWVKNDSKKPQQNYQPQKTRAESNREFIEKHYGINEDNIIDTEIF